MIVESLRDVPNALIRTRVPKKELVTNLRLIDNILMRLAFVFLVIIFVLMVGLPFGPSDQAYLLMRNFGLDVSMAPITVDTSMMTDNQGRSSYDKKVQLIVSDDSGPVTIDPRHLHFYQHKIPLHHYYEFAGYGQEIMEGKIFLCRAFQQFVKNKIRSFVMSTGETNDTEMGFNEVQHCP